MLQVATFFLSEILRHQGLIRGVRLYRKFTLTPRLIARSHCKSLYCVGEVGYSISDVKHNLNYQVSEF